MRTFVKTVLPVSLFAVLLTPLIWINALYFPAVTGKAIFFYAAIEVALLLYFWHLFLERRPLVSSVTLVSVAFFSFIAVVGLATVFGDAPGVSFYSNFERMDGFLTLLHLGAFFWLVTALFTTERTWNHFFLTSLGVSLIVFVHALSQYLVVSGTAEAETRVDVLLGNATFLGAYAMLHVFIALWLAASAVPYSRWQWVLIAAALANVATIVFSGTRAALLGLLAGAGVAFGLYFLRTDRLRRVQKLAVVLGLGILLAASIGAVYGFRAHLEEAPMLGRLIHLTPETITEQPRYYIWSAALAGVADRPLLGRGPDQFLGVYSQYYDPATRNRFNVAIGEFWIDRAHNMYLEWAVAGGAPALLLYLVLFATLFYTVLRNAAFSTAEAGIWAGLLAAYLVNNLFAFDSLSTYIILAAVAGYLHRKAPVLRLPPVAPASLPPMRRVLAAAAIAGVVVIFASVTVRGYASARLLADFLKAGPGTEAQHEIMATLLADKPYAPWHVSTALADEVRRVLKEEAGTPAVRAKMAVLIETHIKTEVAARDPSARALLTYCRTMRQAGKLDDARGLCQAAANKAPSHQEVLIELGGVYREQEAYEESLRAFERAFVGEPQYDPARNEYAAALVYAGEIERAREVLVKRYGTHLVDDRSLLAAYLYQNKLADALAIVETHLQKEPSAIGYHLSRVSIYLTLGERERAIEAVEEFMALDPSLESLGAEVIRQIESGQTVVGEQIRF